MKDSMIYKLREFLASALSFITLTFFRDDAEEIIHEIDALTTRAEKAENDAEKWKEVAQMLAEELTEANSERFLISWEDASESSPAWIAYINLRDKSSKKGE